MVSVIDKKDVQNMDDFRHQMMDAFLLTNEIQDVTPAIRQVIHSSDLTEIDFVMGVQVPPPLSSHPQGWRRFVYECPTLLSPTAYNMFIGNLTVKQSHSFDWGRPVLLGARGAINAAVFDDADRMNDEVEEAAVPVAFALPQGAMMKGARAMLRKQRYQAPAKRLGQSVLYHVNKLVWLPTFSFDPDKGVTSIGTWAQRTRVIRRLEPSTYVLYSNFVSAEGVLEEEVSEFLVRKDVATSVKVLNPFILHDNDKTEIPLNLYNQRSTSVVIGSRVHRRWRAWWR